MKKFLIGQLACFGDCLYATTVAKQIKHDFPDSHITWAIAGKYKSVLQLNPHVDEIWEVPLINNDYYDEGWLRFKKEAIRRKDAKVYDEIVFTQLAKENWKNYDGTIRSSTLRGYKRPITVTVDPVIRLSREEVNKVTDFAAKHHLADFKELILFEYSPGSGQSFITFPIALQIAQQITSLYKHVCFVFSGPNPLEQISTQIIDASELTFRENAELTKYCTLLLGCSSGITWLSTSDWAKKLKTVQLLNRQYAIFAGIKYDFERWKLPTENIIEITLPEGDHVINCIKAILDNGFEMAKHTFDESYMPNYYNFSCMIEHVLLQNNGISEVASVTFQYKKRNRHLKFSTLIYYCTREIYKLQKEKVPILNNRIIRKLISYLK